MQIEQIETFCADVRDGLDNATFEDKQHYSELIDMQGTLANENGERVIYIKCKLCEQRLVLSATLPYQNNQKDNSIILTARLVIEALKKPKPASQTHP